MARFYHGFFRKLGMTSYRGLKRAKAKTQKRPGFLVRRGVRGFRAADLADVPTPPSLFLGAYAPDIIPNTFPDVKGGHPLLICKHAAKTIGGSR